MQVSQIISPAATHFLSRKAQDAIDAGAGVRAVVLATVDGFTVTSAMQTSLDPARIAALASSIATIGSVATQEAGLGKCTSLTLNTDQGFAVLRHLQVEAKELVLIMIADGSSVLAQVLYQAHQLAREAVAL